MTFYDLTLLQGLNDSLQDNLQISNAPRGCIKPYIAVL